MDNLQLTKKSDSDDDNSDDYQDLFNSPLPNRRHVDVEFTKDEGSSENDHLALDQYSGRDGLDKIQAPPHGGPPPPPNPRIPKIELIPPSDPESDPESSSVYSSIEDLSFPSSSSSEEEVHVSPPKGHLARTTSLSDLSSSLEQYRSDGMVDLEDDHLSIDEMFDSDGGVSGGELLGSISEMTKDFEAFQTKVNEDFEEKINSSSHSLDKKARGSDPDEKAEGLFNVILHQLSASSSTSSKRDDVDDQELFKMHVQEKVHLFERQSHEEVRLQRQVPRRAKSLPRRSNEVQPMLLKKTHSYSSIGDFSDSELEERMLSKRRHVSHEEVMVYSYDGEIRVEVENVSASDYEGQDLHVEHEGGGKDFYENYDQEVQMDVEDLDSSDYELPNLCVEAGEVDQLGLKGRELYEQYVMGKEIRVDVENASVSDGQDMHIEQYVVGGDKLNRQTSEASSDMFNAVVGNLESGSVSSGDISSIENMILNKLKAVEVQVQLAVGAGFQSDSTNTSGVYSNLIAPEGPFLATNPTAVRGEHSRLQGQNTLQRKDSAKRRKKERHGAEVEVEKISNNKDLTPDEKRELLISYYISRTHLRKSFNKQFSNILRMRNPELADRVDVKEANQINNSVDRYELKNVQTLANREYMHMKASGEFNAEHQPPVRPRAPRPPTRTSSKPAQHTELAALVDEITSLYSQEEQMYQNQYLGTEPDQVYQNEGQFSMGELIYENNQQVEEPFYLNNVIPDGLDEDATSDYDGIDDDYDHIYDVAPERSNSEHPRAPPSHQPPAAAPPSKPPPIEDDGYDNELSSEDGPRDNIVVLDLKVDVTDDGYDGLSSSDDSLIGFAEELHHTRDAVDDGCDWQTDDMEEMHASLRGLSKTSVNMAELLPPSNARIIHSMNNLGTADDSDHTYDSLPDEAKEQRRTYKSTGDIARTSSVAVNEYKGTFKRKRDSRRYKGKEPIYPINIAERKSSTDSTHHYDDNPEDYIDMSDHAYDVAPYNTGRVDRVPSNSSATYSRVHRDRIQARSIDVMKECDRLYNEFGQMSSTTNVEPGSRERPRAKSASEHRHHVGLGASRTSSVASSYRRTTETVAWTRQSSNHAELGDEMAVQSDLSHYDWHVVDEDSDNDLLTISFSKPETDSLQEIGLRPQLPKLGATIIQDKKTGDIKIKRILEKSPIAVCNKIHPGDQLKKINGASIADKTLDEICDLLSMTTETHCSLTIASAGTVQGAVVPPKSRFFRAFFNYEPLADNGNPCREASFSFELGDILEVLNTEDPSWWQAKKFNSQTVGLIPSTEQRIRFLNGQSKSDSTLVRVKSKPKKRTRDFLFSLTDSKDYKEPLTYIEVTHIKPSKNKRRPIIITGAKGFGGNCVRDKLFKKYPGKYHMAVPHTTKTRAAGEVEGESYYYCNKSEMDALIKGKEMIEHTKLGGHYYGTSYQSVEDLINSGRNCILNLHPQLLPLLCNGVIRPHVIFIESSSEVRMKHLMEKQSDELPVNQRKFTGGEIRELRFNSERLLRRYTEFVDTIITLESLTSTVDLINRVVERVAGYPAWVPKAWLEPN